MTDKSQNINLKELPLIYFTNSTNYLCKLQKQKLEKMENKLCFGKEKKYHQNDIISFSGFPVLPEIFWSSSHLLKWSRERTNKPARKITE